MRKIIEYKIIHDTADCVVNTVNKLLKEDWELFGTPYGSGAGSDSYQAMVKYSEPPSPYSR